MSDYLALKGPSDGTEAGVEQDNINVVHKPINQPKPLCITVGWRRLDWETGVEDKLSVCAFSFSSNE